VVNLKPGIAACFNIVVKIVKEMAVLTLIHVYLTKFRN
jgi:hypothetical protein